jgi:hypothetical protein
MFISSLVEDLQLEQNDQQQLKDESSLTEIFHWLLSNGITI